MLFKKIFVNDKSDMNLFNFFKSAVLIKSSVGFPIITSLIVLCVLFTFSSVTGRMDNTGAWFVIHVTTLLMLWVIYVYGEIMPADRSVQIVHLIFRHGHRNSLESYDTDPYKHHKWIDGYGALTNKGKMQLYQLGTTMHARYKKFFTEDFETSKIFVRSSDVDRCIMSASTFLAGFFPVTEKYMWNPDINWTPIPIHTLPSENDTLIRHSAPCPAFVKEKAAVLRSDDWKKKEVKNKYLYKYINEKTHLKINNMYDLSWLYFTLQVQDHHGLKLPEWSKKIYPDAILPLAVVGFELLTANTLMKRLKSGPVLKEIIRTTRQKEKNNMDPDVDVFIYSGHDLTLVNVMNALGIFDHKLPDYGATLAIEGHSTCIDKMEIRIFYFKNYAATTPIELAIPDCGAPCLLDDFEMIYDSIIPKKSREIECGIIT